MMHLYDEWFINAEDSNFYYILGAFMTDGSIYYNPHKRAYRAYLYSNDLDWLKIINQYFSKSNLIYKNRACNVLTISNKKIVEKLIECGCVPNKSLSVKFPNVPKKYLPDFIRGCIDGDGSIGIRNNNKYKQPEIYLCSSSEEFIKKYYQILIENNIKCTMKFIPASTRLIFNKSTKTHDHWRVCSRGISNTKELAKWIYYDEHCISMKRKLESILSIHKLNKQLPGPKKKIYG